MGSNEGEIGGERTVRYATNEPREQTSLQTGVNEKECWMEPITQIERYKAALFSLQIAHSSFDVWWFYKNIETRDLEVMNHYPLFFVHDEEVQFRAIIVSLYSLYDSHPGTITLRSLIHEVENSSAGPIWKKYKSVHRNVRKIETLRHKAIAHRDGSLSIEAIFQEAAITSDVIKRLLEDTVMILSMTADALGIPRPLLSDSMTEQVRSLFSLIRRNKAIDQLNNSYYPEN